MQYGYFDDQVRAYAITWPDTPQSWSNYLGSTEAWEKQAPHE